MTQKALRNFLYATILALPLILSPVTAQPLLPPRVLPAVDGVMTAFGAHRLVGINDNHGLAQELDFYAALVRDPRFAREVGNVVVEFGGASAQPILDRYLLGGAVPYAELRRVWTDVVGWAPTVRHIGFMNFYAQVRAVNLTLPQDQRIRVWLGEPKIDWSKIRARSDLLPLLESRDRHPAELIKREILAQGKKALVIYGGQHLERPSVEAAPYIKAQQAQARASGALVWGNLVQLVEMDYPNAFFIVTPYSGYLERGCSERFEKGLAAWPVPAFADLGRGGSLEKQILQPGCRFSLLPRARANPDPEATPAQRAHLEEQARQESVRLDAGVDFDALLYLGPAASLTRSPIHPDFYLDVDFITEINRRRQFFGPGQPLPPTEMRDEMVSPRKWRDYGAP